MILRADSTADARGLFDRGALYVAVPDVLASDQLIEHVVEVIDNPEASGRLESSHRVELQTLEDLGFSSIADERELV